LAGFSDVFVVAVRQVDGCSTGLIGVSIDTFLVGLCGVFIEGNDGGKFSFESSLVGFVVFVVFVGLVEIRGILFEGVPVELVPTRRVASSQT